MERKKTYQIIGLVIALGFVLLFAFMYGSCRQGAFQPEFEDDADPSAQVTTVVVRRVA